MAQKLPKSGDHPTNERKGRSPPVWARSMVRDFDKEESADKLHREIERDFWVFQNKIQIAVLITAILAMSAAIVSAFYSFKAFREAQRQANAAIDGNKISTKALVAVQPAFVTGRARFKLSGNFASDRIASTDLFYSLSIEWENSGSTPTLGLVIGSTQLISNSANGQLFQSGFPTIKTGITYTLPPRATLVGQQAFLSYDHLNAVRDGRSDIRVNGLAKYYDVFQQFHFTMACYVMMVAPLDYSKGIEQEQSGTPCTNYNCADEDCERYDNEPQIHELLQLMKETRPSESRAEGKRGTDSLIP